MFYYVDLLLELLAGLSCSALPLQINFLSCYWYDLYFDLSSQIER